MPATSSAITVQALNVGDIKFIADLTRASMSGLWMTAAAVAATGLALVSAAGKPRQGNQGEGLRGGRALGNCADRNPSNGEGTPARQKVQCPVNLHVDSAF